MKKRGEGEREQEMAILTKIAHQQLTQQCNKRGTNILGLGEYQVFISLWNARTNMELGATGGISFVHCNRGDSLPGS